MKLAVPTMGQGGLDGERSGHFGHCDCFTIVDIKNGNIENVSILENPPHIEGGCLRPVNLLADAGGEHAYSCWYGCTSAHGLPGRRYHGLLRERDPGNRQGRGYAHLRKAHRDAAGKRLSALNNS